MVSAACLSIVLTCGASSPEGLPEWTSEDIANMQANPNGATRLGGLLWPAGADGGLNTEADALPGQDVADSPSLAQPAADLRSFLLPSLSGSDGAKPEVESIRRPTPFSELKSVSKGFLQDCYRTEPEQYLIDPSYHLSELEREDLERFLSYHARDAKIRAFVLVTGREEKIGPDLDLAKIAQGTLLRGSNSLLVVPLGDPYRARLFFTNNIHHSVKAPLLAEILSSCVQDGQTKSLPSEQLHRMLVRLSIRLFWLQNQIPVIKPPVIEPDVTAAAAPPPTKMLVSEVAAVRGPPGFEDGLAGLMSKTHWSGFAIGLSVLAGLVAIRWRRYKLRHYEWLLPEPDRVDLRLGGEFAGGGGVWLAYR